MTTVLSIENALGWSWGITIGQLIGRLPRCDFIRVRRGLYYCEYEPCGAAHLHKLDPALEEHFDILLVQNHDGVRYLDRRDKVVLRIGGIFVHPQLDPTRYLNDFRAVGAIIATNEQLADLARAVNPHTTVIPNGVDLAHFKPGPFFPGRDPARPFTLGFAGNIAGMGGPYKGWKFFMQAGVNLAVEGVRQKYLLHLHNQIPHDQMPAGFYHQIDALVLPSQGEGCSNVVTEALACGVPVIMTKVGFHGELLTHGENVWYIDRDPETASPHTTEQICDAVRHLMREPDLYERLSLNGRAFAVAHHDVTKVAAQYDAVFQGLLGRRASERSDDEHQQTHGQSHIGGGRHLD